MILQAAMPELNNPLTLFNSVKNRFGCPTGFRPLRRRVCLPDVCRMHRIGTTEKG